jgi:glyoxylate reductase
MARGDAEVMVSNIVPVYTGQGATSRAAGGNISAAGRSPYKDDAPARGRAGIQGPTMTSNRPRVIVTRRLPDAIETRMMELFDVRLNLDDTPMTHAQLVEAVADADVLVPTVTDRIDADVIAAAGSRLKLIATFSTGIDHIDLDAAKAKSITVTNTPGVLTEDTADMTMALLLAVPRRLAEGERLIRSGAWTGWSPTFMLGRRISGKRLGIVGMGRIGQAVARRARGFGVSIHYHNRRRVHEEIERELEATYWDSLDQMLARMDIVSVNCPRTPATYHLLNRRRLQLLKKDAYLVNTSRGEVVDEAALTQLLGQGAIAGAGLDVFENEPAVNPKLLALDNVVLLPHMGSATIEGRVAMGEKVIINIRTMVDGHTPPDRVLEAMF